MARAKHAERAVAKPFAAELIGWVGVGLAGAAAVACAVLAVISGIKGKSHSALLLYGLLFLPVAALGLALFRDFVRLGDWTVAPEVPLGLKLLGHLGRILGSLATAGCVVLAVTTIVLPKTPRPGLVAVFLLGIFISLLVRTMCSAVSELRTWARPGSLVVAGLAVALLLVGLIFNLTKWRIPGATLPIALFLGGSAVLFLFLLVYFTLPPVVEAFESRRL